MDVELLCADVAESLWRIYHGRVDAPHLIWPATRGDAARISEQESKILITQWLERAGEFYSVETPTREMYRQSGNADMSARLDVTVYGSRDRSDRAFNMELKAGTASLEAFRKDFEKLLREGVPGVWFHTLTSATTATWRVLEEKTGVALERVLEHAEAATDPVHFAFCVLASPMLVQFDIDFSGEWRGALGEQLRIALERPARPAWTPTPASGRTSARPATRSYSGATRKALVYMPALEPTTFVHLSVRGDSYALRSFGGARPRSRWVEPDCKTVGDLLARYPTAVEVDVAGEGKPLDSELEYWASRVAALNREHGLA